MATRTAPSPIARRGPTNQNDDQNSNKRTRTGDPSASTITTSAGCRLTRGEVWVWMDERRCFGCGGPLSGRLPGLGKTPAPA